MSGRGDHRESERLARLQRLAATVSREDLGRACRETDTRAESERDAAEQNRMAEAAFDEVLAQPRLCLDRLTLAGLDLEACEANLAASRVALAAARESEATALARDREAGQRLEWIGAHARGQRRKYLERREERAMAEATVLRARRGDAR